MLKEEDFQRFCTTLNDSKPIYAINFIGEDMDDIEFRVTYRGYIRSALFINILSERISAVLFSLKRSKALKEFGNDYIHILEEEFYQAVDSFKRITIRNVEFWFQEKATIYYREPEEDVTQEKKIYFTIDTVDEKYFHEIVEFSNARYELCTKFLEGLNQMSNDSTSTIVKLELNLSVADLALLFRLLDEEKLIKYKQKVEIYRFITTSFRTEKQNNISEDSIKNKFLSPDTTSIKNIEILLTNLKLQLKKIQNN